MGVLSYSEWKRKITHLYSRHYSLGFIPIAIVTGAVRKRNTNASEEVSTQLLPVQRPGQTAPKEENGGAV